jgi:Carboxypeptidase regulatory-like domain
MRITPGVVVGLVGVCFSAALVHGTAFDAARSGLFDSAQGTPPPASPTPGQPPQPGQVTPPRAGRPGDQQIKGTAILRGRVASAENGAPLRRAMVRATSQDGRSGGSTTTDAEGRFEIKELPAGRYSLSANKAGYVPMQYGQRRADRPGSGTLLDVLDGQLVEKIGFSLVRGSVITGRIVDEFGEPVAGAQVSAQRFQYISGSRRLTPIGTDSTDDLGHFRVYGLPAGDYIVAGAMRGPMSLAPGMSSSEVEGYAPTYYPGTPNPAESQRVIVKAGAETAGITFALSVIRLLSVSGRVLSSTGEPAIPGMVQIMSSDRTIMMLSAGGIAQTRGDGQFRITGLTPGTYTLQFRPSGNPGPNVEFGQAKITLAGEDIDNLTVVTSRGAVARGIITTDENEPLPVRTQLVRILATSVDPMQMTLGGASPTINDDWTFEISGLLDQRLIRASAGEPGTWFLKGVYWNDQDVTDTPIEFVPGQVVEGLRIVFTRKATEINGRVTDDRNRPALDASIIVFPNDAARWAPGTRFIRTARPDQEGRYNLRDLPPYDEYRVVAVSDLEPGRFSDPEFLESVRESAARFSLNEGATKVQDLKVMRAP